MSNGSWITRDELAAHIRRIDESLIRIDTRMGKVEDAVGANTRWVSARLTVLIDRFLPVMLVAAVVWFLSQ